MTLVPYYEQAELVQNATWTVKKALLIGGLLVVLTLGLFLGNLRTAFIVALSLPICALVAVLCMGLQGISANLMSLGGIAIAIGMLGDGAIVMVENIYRHLGERHGRGESKATVIFDAAPRGEPADRVLDRDHHHRLPAALHPARASRARCSRRWRSRSPSRCWARCWWPSSWRPVLSLYLLKQAPHRELALVRVLKAVYRPLLAGALRCKCVVHRRWRVAALVGSLALVPRLGTEFIPTLEEGLDPDRRDHGAVHLAGEGHRTGHGDGAGDRAVRRRSTRRSRGSAGRRRAAIRTRSTTPRSTSS